MYEGPALSKLIALSQVKGYQRRTSTGKVVQVSPYASNRSGKPTRAIYTAYGISEFAGRVVSYAELHKFLAKMLEHEPSAAEVRAYARLFKVRKVDGEPGKS